MVLPGAQEGYWPLRAVSHYYGNTIAINSAAMCGKGQDFGDEMVIINALVAINNGGLWGVLEVLHGGIG